MLRNRLDGTLASASRSIPVVLLGLVLVALPFETLAPAVAVGPLIVTTPEWLAYAAVIAWVVTLLHERRMPRLPLTVGALLLALAAVNLLSAVLAGSDQDEALKFTARSSMFWLMFTAAADMIRDQTVARRLIILALAATTVSAAIGLAALVRGTNVGLGPAGDYAIGGVLRASGTFEYPNIAAMAWETLALAGLGVLLGAESRVVRAALGGALVVVAAALLLTFSRGAILGVTAGLVTASVFALVRGSRRWAIAPVAVAASFVVTAVVVNLVVLPGQRLVAEGDAGLYGAVYEAPASLGAKPGERLQLTVTVTNTGALTWNNTGSGSFRLGYHWLDPVDGTIDADTSERWSLPTPVAPFHSAAVAVALVAPEHARDWLIGWDMVHEGRAFFADRGVAPRATLLRVSSNAGATASPVPGSIPATRPRVPPAPARSELWLAARLMVAERPLLGTGPGTFRLLYGEYLGRTEWDRHIHSNSLYYELAATTGLLGLAVFSALVGRVLIAPARRLASRGADAIPSAGWLMTAGLVAAAVALLVHGTIDYFLGFTPTGLLFWILLGLGYGSARGTGRGAGSARESSIASASSTA